MTAISQTANDNSPRLYPSIDRAVAGQALTIRQAHRKFGRSYAAFVGHSGDGKHVVVRKLIASMWKSRWTKPMKVARADIMNVDTRLAGA